MTREAVKRAVTSERNWSVISRVANISSLIAIVVAIWKGGAWAEQVEQRLSSIEDEQVTHMDEGSHLTMTNITDKVPTRLEWSAQQTNRDRQLNEMLERQRRMEDKIDRILER